MVADVWFMGVICHFERDRIVNSVAFVPTGAKLESVYQRLKMRTSGWIEVRDKEYLAAMATAESNKVFHHAHIINQYIRAREVELRATGTIFTQTNRFELRAASLVSSNDPATAYYGNGIALVAVEELAQR